MKATRRQAVAGIGAVLLPLPSIAKEPRRLFFIGNSFLAEHEIPARVLDLLKAGQIGAGSDDPGPTIWTRTRNGASLTDHVSDGDVLARIRQFRPDTIVLQDYSTEPLTEQGRARSDAAIGRILDVTDACPVFVATWPRAPRHKLYRYQGMPKTPAEMSTTVQAHFEAMAERHGGVVAPVGAAWLNFMRRQAELSDDYVVQTQLWARDGYHASEGGACLVSLTIAAALGADIANMSLPAAGPWQEIRQAVLKVRPTPVTHCAR